jgi:excisionase family DNA binding protein
MGGKRRTIITVESHQLTVVRSRRPIEMWCKRCGQELPMLTPEAAAVLAGVSPRTIYRCIESGELHFIETGGLLLICSGSM